MDSSSRAKMSLQDNRTLTVADKKIEASNTGTSLKSMRHKRPQNTSAN